MEKTPEELAAMVEHSQLAGAVGQQAQAAAAAQYYVEEQQKSLADAQLECKTTLSELSHQLRQDVWTDKGEGKFEWVEIEDEKKRRLTDDGVNRIMELMSSYVNKENLLSNFDEKQINQIMLTMRLAFSANILMRYKIYFRQPTFEECKEIFLSRIAERKKLKMFAGDLLGKELDEKDVGKKLLDEFENRIEQELNKIKEEKTKEMLSEFELLFEQLSQLVFATLNRAWRGEERGSLRRHTNISEIIGGRPMQPKEGGGVFKWVKG